MKNITKTEKAAITAQRKSEWRAVHMIALQTGLNPNRANNFAIMAFIAKTNKV